VMYIKPPESIIIDKKVPKKQGCNSWARNPFKLQPHHIFMPVV